MRRFPLHLTLCAFLTAAPAALAGPLDTQPACDGEKKPKDGTGNPDKAFAEPSCDGEKKPKDGTGNPDKASVDPSCDGEKKPKDGSGNPDKA